MVVEDLQCREVIGEFESRCIEFLTLFIDLLELGLVVCEQFARVAYQIVCGEVDPFEFDGGQGLLYRILVRRRKADEATELRRRSMPPASGTTPGRIVV